MGGGGTITTTSSFNHYLSQYIPKSTNSKLEQESIQNIANAKHQSTTRAVAIDQKVQKLSVKHKYIRNQKRHDRMRGERSN